VGVIVVWDDMSVGRQRWEMRVLDDSGRLMGWGLQFGENCL